MGEHEGWAEPARLLPNGLLPNAAPVIQGLDSERWLKAEERTAELIARIQPNKPSEERRNAVADYVQRLITKCFPCQVEVVIQLFCHSLIAVLTLVPQNIVDFATLFYYANFSYICLQGSMDI